MWRIDCCEMDKYHAFAIVIVMCLVKNSFSQPYANDYPYQKYGFNRESSQADTDGTRYMKNNLRDQGGRLKANTDTGLTYNLDSNTNKHDLQQTKRGSSTDNLTHVQGEDYETDKTHKRKHMKSGFQNSYHKDENGSRSSFYEDSDDTGGKTVYDKKHGTQGDQQDTQYNEGLKNGVSRDKYDDRKTGFNNRDLMDRHQSYVEDQGKQHGYNDNYKAGLDDRFEVVRRPYSDYHNQYDNYNRRMPQRRIDDDYDRYTPSQHWGHNSRIPQASPIDQRDLMASPNRDFQTRRKITIFEDPRDEYIDPKVDRFHDNGNYMTRSEITRRFDYGPANNDRNDRSSLRMRYRGL